MSLGRGFRRLFIVLSVAVLGLGLALDVHKLWSHAKIYATLTDGSTKIYDTWNLVGSPPYERDNATRKMVADLVRMPPRWEDLSDTPPALPDPLKGAIRLDPDLKTFRVVRGPAAWSREDFKFTPIAAGIVVLLWAGFFALRWVVRGFTAQPPP